MASTTDISGVLAEFTTAVSTATQSLPEAASFQPPENGITLLDTKNEIFLSYLQTLALRNLEVLRSCKKHLLKIDGQEDGEAESDNKLRDGMVKKLVEHRVYLEKGVRSLEDRIRYQVDKVVRAADDEARAAVQKAAAKPATNGHAKEQSEEESGSDAESGAEGGAEIDPLSYRPNPAAFIQAKATNAEMSRDSKRSTDGVYRPPRISATTMPTTERREKSERAPRRSATMDEYVSTELSTAPTAEPSIGSTITDRGRKTKSAKQLAEEGERREYEETHLTRLPTGSKKDKQRGQGGRQGGYGGEEWRGLGESLDRIGDLTRKKSRDGALGKSRKRAVEDGPRDEGFGGAFEQKKRRFMKKSGR